MADYLSGKDGAVSIDIGGTPIVLQIIEWNYREKNDVARGRAAGDRGTGRTYLGTDWELNVRAQIKAADTTPNFFRRGADIVFLAASDGAGSPACKVAGTGMNSESALGVPVGDYLRFDLKIESSDPAGANLPVVTNA